MVRDPAPMRGRRQDGARVLWRRGDLSLASMDSNLSSAPSWLCNSGEVTCPLCASVSLSVNPMSHRAILRIRWVHLELSKGSLLLKDSKVCPGEKGYASWEG